MKMQSNHKKEVKFAPKLKLVKRNMANNNSKIRARFVQLSFSPNPSSSISSSRFQHGFSAPAGQISPLRPTRLNFDLNDEETQSYSSSFSMYLEEIRKVVRTPAEINYLCRNLPLPPPGFKYSDHPVFRSLQKS